jgi:hypothetical protein
MFDMTDVQVIRTFADKRTKAAFEDVPAQGLGMTFGGLVARSC